MKVSVTVALELETIQAIDGLAGPGKRSAWVQGVVEKALGDGAPVAPVTPPASSRSPLDGIPVRPASELVADGDYRREPVDDGEPAW